MKKFLNFETLLAPVLLKILYPVLVVYHLYNHSSRIFSILGNLRYSDSVLSSLMDALILTLYMLVYPFVLRVVFELALAVFRLYENSYKLANDEKLPGVINCLTELKKEAKKTMATQNFGQPQGFGTMNNQPQNFGQQPQQPFYNQGMPQQNMGMPQNPNFQQPQQPVQPAQPTQPAQPNQPNQPQQ